MYNVLLFFRIQMKHTVLGGEYREFSCLDEEREAQDDINQRFESLLYLRHQDKEEYEEHYRLMQFQINEKHILWKNIDLLSQLKNPNFEIDMSPVSFWRSRFKVIFQEVISILSKEWDQSKPWDLKFYCLKKWPNANSQIIRLSELRTQAGVDMTRALTRFVELSNK